MSWPLKNDRPLFLLVSLKKRRHGDRQWRETVDGGDFKVEEGIGMLIGRV